MDRQDAVVIARVLFMFLVVVICSLLKIPLFIGLPAIALSYFFGFAVADTYESWVMMGSLALNLADEAAVNLDGNLETQIAEGMRRPLPPRQMFACAIARPSEPIVMYRGIKVWNISPLSNPEDTRSGLLCWEYRP